MEGHSKISSMDIKAYIKNLRKNPRFTEEMLQLVESDLNYGLSITEIEEYTGKKYEFTQMKVYSTCLRNGYGADVIGVIAGDGMTGEQMTVALEFYEKGVPLDTIAGVAGDKENTAYAMKRLFRNVVEKTLDAEKITDNDMAYAKELVEQMKEVVAKINYQEKRYNALNDRLKELQTDREDAEIQNHLLEKLTENEKLLVQQQNQINEGKAAVAKLKQELELVRREKEILVKKSEELENELTNQKMIGQTAKVKESLGTGWSGENKNPQGTMQPQNANGYTMQGINKAPHMYLPPAYHSMEYQAAIADGNMNIASSVPVEYHRQKKEKHLMSAIFSRIFYKKKIDVVRLVAEKNLNPKQLIQIRSAIEKGLDEKQLLVLINSILPPEQMEEIINIAVYENKQREV